MIFIANNLNEIKRWQTLLPNDLSPRITIAPATDTRSNLIKTVNLDRDRSGRGAILLAQQFGYSQPKAYRSLYRAIKMLLARSPQGWLAKLDRRRLQVLEISAIENRKKVQQSTQISRGKTNAIIS
jgi:hypothetical protein